MPQGAARARPGADAGPGHHAAAQALPDRGDTQGRAASAGQYTYILTAELVFVC